MYAIVKDDIVVTTISDASIKYYRSPEKRNTFVLIPDELLSVDIERLRYDGGEIIDVGTSARKFFVDKRGVKHISDSTDDERQVLYCRFDDELVCEDGKWRVLKDEEKLNRIRSKMIEAVKTEAGIRIMNVMPLWKQINMLKEIIDIMVEAMLNKKVLSKESLKKIEDISSLWDSAVVKNRLASNLIEDKIKEEKELDNIYKLNFKDDELWEGK